MTNEGNFARSRIIVELENEYIRNVNVRQDRQTKTTFTSSSGPRSGSPQLSCTFACAKLNTYNHTILCSSHRYLILLYFYVPTTILSNSLLMCYVQLTMSGL